MLHSIKRLRHCRVIGRRGTEVGRVTDTYFDDEKWVVRYLIVETGDWRHHHRVLISPLAVTSFDAFIRALATELSRAQIESSPGIETNEPVPRPQANGRRGYEGYPWYWAYTASWVWSGASSVVRPSDEQDVWAARQRLAEAPKGQEADPHLRSSRHVVGYRIEASDGAIGHIEDLLFDPETWAIRSAVVHTRNWLPGKRVLISPERIRGVDWRRRSVVVDMCRDAVRDSPAYAPDRLLGKAPPTRRRTST